MKAQFKNLTTLIAKADASAAELQRHRDLLKAAEQKRDKQIASGLVEDVKTRAAISDCDLDCRMLPHRIAAFEAQTLELNKALTPAGAELERAVTDETIRLDGLLQSAGVEKFVAALKPLGVLAGDDLEAAARHALSKVKWGGQLAEIAQNTKNVPPRSLVGNAEPLFKLAESIEKFCR